MWFRRSENCEYSECEVNRFKWKFSEDLSQTHPVKWLIDMRDKYTMAEENGRKVMYEYQLIGWQEIPKEIYVAYKDRVG